MYFINYYENNLFQINYSIIHIMITLCYASSICMYYITPGMVMVWYVMVNSGNGMVNYGALWYIPGAFQVW